MYISCEDICIVNIVMHFDFGIYVKEVSSSYAELPNGFSLFLIYSTL